jgi:hypothetical protein
MISLYLFAVLFALIFIILIIDIIRNIKPVLEIKNRSGILHFRRWKIFKFKYCALYFHGIYHKDEEKHLHNHPWNYASLILKGGIYEIYQKDINSRECFHYVGPLSFIKRKASWFHKLRILKDDKPVYTLFFTWGKEKDWGYNVSGMFVNHQKYRILKNQDKLQGYGKK